jgi:hypothetical protein
MTSSGTYNWSLSIGEGVLAAYERIQIRSPSLRAEHFTTATREINLLFAEWGNKQVNLWKVVQDQITLTAGVATISVPVTTVLILDATINTNQGSQFGQTNRYVTQFSRTEYASLSNPNAPGPPTQFWFDRLLSPNVTFWPVPDNNGPYTFNYWRVDRIQDANLANAETPDIPYLWLDAMVAGMAHRLARVYAPQLEAVRKSDAGEAWTVAAAQNIEVANVSLVPPLRRYYPR